MSERVFLAELNKLKAVQTIIENKNDLKIITESPDISLFTEGLNKKSIDEIEENRNVIKKLLELVKDIKSSLIDVKNIDKNELKKQMVYLQENLLNFKQKNNDSLKTLKDEEKLLEDDLKLYFNIFDKRTENSKNFAIRSKSCINFEHDNLSEEAKEFLKFVHQNNGHQNGWNLRDHTIFIQTKKKYKKQEEMVKALQHRFPDLSANQIIAHDKWFEQYTILLNKQKDAIKNWRVTKEMNKTEAKDESKAPRSATNSIIPKIDEDIKKKIAHWKEMQQVKIAVEEQVKLDENKRLKEIELKKQLKVAEIKETVVKWKLAKQAEEELQEQKKTQILKEEEERKADANQLIKQYQKQDLRYIKKMQTALLRSRKKEQNINIRFKKHNEPVVRDADRLFKPTQQWISRISSSEIRKISCPDIKKVEKLRVPEWRKLIL